MRAIGRDPVFIEDGAGARMMDVDGNEYIDWVCSWGPLILGHAHPAIVDAVAEAVSSGTSFGAPTEREVQLGLAFLAGGQDSGGLTRWEQYAQVLLGANEFLYVD